MKQRGPRRPALPPGTSPILVALLAIEIGAALTAVLVGVPLGRLLLTAFPVLGLTVALLNPASEDLIRRRPALTVTASGADGDGRVNAPRPSPWPVDIGRVVRNEATVARSTANAREGIATTFLRLGGLLGQEPTAADHEQARAAFEQGVQAYEEECSEWLLAYVTASENRSRTFEVSLTVANAGAHAENVKIDIHLPRSVTVTDDDWGVPLPPRRPEYERPRPRVLYLGGEMGAVVPANRHTPSEFLLRGHAVEGRRDDELSFEVGDVENGRTVAAGKPFHLLVDGVGEHSLGWTAYTKSGRKPTTGVLTLVVPPRPRGRPAIGRMQGVLAFPDVPLGDGSTYSVRASEPPPRPDEAQGPDVNDRLRRSHAVMKWEQLGLDPATDEVGPSTSA